METIKGRQSKEGPFCIHQSIVVGSSDPLIDLASLLPQIVLLIALCPCPDHSGHRACESSRILATRSIRISIIIT